MSFNGTTKLLNGVTFAQVAAGNITGNPVSSAAFWGNRTFQAVITGTGALTGTILIQCSNDNVNFITLGTITLSGTTTASDGFASSGEWAFHRAYIAQNGITGTGAVVNVTMAS